MHVFLFSDHVSLEDELELKQRGEELGLLVMGPGCGTAMLGNVGLGFANVVTSGPVGIVAAAGTGAQESACLLDAAGVGVSQIVGVGGRDLSADIGGIMFRQAMHMLAADDETETLLLVSKPPAPEVVASLADDLPEGKRVVAAFVGWEGTARAPFEIHDTLEAAARAAAGTEPEDLSELEAAVDAARERSAGRRLLGLFSGGSLAHEAVTLLEPELGPLEGNVGHGPDERNGGHAVLDLGEEEYTQGRPHPMVDLDVRLGFLEEAAEDDDVGCVLLDVVLGHGGHADPASGLSDAIAAAAKNAVVLARVCGTERRSRRTPPARRRSCATPARSSRRPTPPPRAWRCGRSRPPRSRHEDRDAHVLGQAARRRRARARGRRGAGRPRPRGLRRRRWPSPARRSSARRRCETRLVEHVPTAAGLRRAHPRDGRRLPRGPAPAAGRRRLRHRPRAGLHLGQRRARPARRGRRSSTSCAPSTTSTTSSRRR